MLFIPFFWLCNSLTSCLRFSLMTDKISHEQFNLTFVANIHLFYKQIIQSNYTIKIVAIFIILNSICCNQRIVNNHLWRQLFR